MVIGMKATFSMTLSRARASLNGMMELATKVNSGTVLAMVLE